MKHFRWLFSAPAVLALTLMLVACGHAQSNTGYPTTTSSGSSGSTPTPTTSATGAVVDTASETVNGKTVTALTDNKGLTLYYFTSDTATTSACTTSACTTNWPPYLSNDGMPTSTATLKLNVQKNANGSQVTYKGYPLYTFKGDTGPDQTNGEGKANNTWHVATTDIPLIAGVISTTSVMVNGTSVTALTNDKGWTLYYFTPDTVTKSACTGTCATTWPPVVSTGTPASTTPLPGTLALQANGNGSQVTYNGHPLYTFAADGGPGQTKGEGKANNTWHVATTDLAVLGASSATSTQVPSGGSGGGYGY